LIRLFLIFKFLSATFSIAEVYVPPVETPFSFGRPVLSRTSGAGSCPPHPSPSPLQQVQSHASFSVCRLRPALPLQLPLPSPAQEFTEGSLLFPRIAFPLIDPLLDFTHRPDWVKMPRFFLALLDVLLSLLWALKPPSVPPSSAGSSFSKASASWSWSSSLLSLFRRFATQSHGISRLTF